MKTKYDLKWLETFIKVAKLKSFAKTSEALGISKSHVTTIINQLEKTVNMKLLARTTREVNLTNEGREFFERCEEIMTKVDHLNDFLDECKEISGVLKIVLPPYFSRYHIIPYFEEFLALHPKLKLNITLTENPVNIIKEGYDLQVRIQIPSEENLEVAHLASNHKIVCASPKYLKKHGTPKEPEDLLNHNCIIFGENKAWEFRNIKTKKITKLNKIDGNIKCDNGEIIKELTLLGLGITLKSSRDVSDELKSGKIVQLLPDYEILHQTKFYIVYPSGRSDSPKLKAFIKFFKEKLSEK
jgi:DNA-binding transcriptional LysR family regulator